MPVWSLVFIKSLLTNIKREKGCAMKYQAKHTKQSPKRQPAVAKAPQPVRAASPVMRTGQPAPAGGAAAKKPKSLARKIGNVFASVIFVFAVILLAVTAYTVIRAHDNPGNTFLLGFKPVIVETGSMNPTIETDSLVILRKTDFADIQASSPASIQAHQDKIQYIGTAQDPAPDGTIVTYELDGQFVTHRAISISDGIVTVQGDNSMTADPQMVTTENFVGTVVLTMNWTAPIINGFQTRPLPTALEYIGLPLLIIVLICVGISLLRRFHRARKENADRGEEDIL